jgi:arsenate reductase
MKPKVLFVCVENSCRSQMAEGFARFWGSDVIDAWSAGSKPSGKVNETGIAVMKEKNIDLSTHTSKGLRDLPTDKWDYVITMGLRRRLPLRSVPSDGGLGHSRPKASPARRVSQGSRHG